MGTLTDKQIAELEIGDIVHYNGDKKLRKFRILSFDPPNSHGMKRFTMMEIDKNGKDVEQFTNQTANIFCAVDKVPISNWKELIS